MWGASNHLHAVGHRHAGHLQGGLQVGGAIVYPRDYVAVKIKQRYHFANWSSTSPTAINSHLRRELVRCLACHGSTFSRVGASGKPGAVHNSSAMMLKVNGCFSPATWYMSAIIPIYVVRRARSLAGKSGRHIQTGPLPSDFPS